jgi:type III secretion protein S
MDLNALTGATAQGMLLCLYCSLPVVIVAACVGLAVSFLQAITSMQDQTLPHGVKLIAVVITIVIAAPFGASAVLHFANQMMRTALPL